MTNQEILQGNWNSIIGSVKARFGQITGDDLLRVQGNWDQLVGLLQKRAGQTREQVEAFLNQCCAEAESAYQRAADSTATAADQAGQYIRDGYAQVADSAERGYGYARDVVERRPVESVAIVAGVSLLTGVLIGLSLGTRR